MENSNINFKTTEIDYYSEWFIHLSPKEQKSHYEELEADMWLDSIKESFED